jgi:phospholipase/carboxylesterase
MLATITKSPQITLLALLLVLGAGCSDDSGVTNDARPDIGGIDTSAGDAAGGDQAMGEGTLDGAHVDGPRADGPSLTPDGVTPDTAPPADAGSPLPPPPAGAKVLRIVVDDTAAKTYAGGELRLKGAFSYDPVTNVITADGSWSGPSVPLWDDGAQGREGPGGVAGDHKLSTVVYLKPGSGSVTLEYGIESPAGWAWPQQGGNAKVTVSGGAGTETIPGPTLAPRAGVDVILRVDASKLSGAAIHGGYEVVALRGSLTHWAPSPCNDFGELGDAKALDGIFTCKLSAQIGKGRRFPHLGLPRPGDVVSFLVDIGGKGYSKTAGLTLQLVGGSGSVNANISASGGNLTFTVPTSLTPKAAPVAETGPLPAGKDPTRPRGRQDLAQAQAGLSGHFYVPSWYDAHTPLPLLVALHGLGEQGIWMINVWEQLAEDYGFILMAPTSMGSNKSWNWIYGKTPHEEQPLLDAVAWLQGRYSVLKDQTAIEGFSDGASMALKIGVQHPGVFCAAIGNSPWTAGSTYVKSPPIKLMITHGQADVVLSFSNAQNLATKLAGQGYSVKTTWYPLGHPYEHHVFPTDDKVGFLRWLDTTRR